MTVHHVTVKLILVLFDVTTLGLDDLPKTLWDCINSSTDGLDWNFVPRLEQSSINNVVSPIAGIAFRHGPQGKVQRIDIRTTQNSLLKNPGFFSSAMHVSDSWYEMYMTGAFLCESPRLDGATGLHLPPSAWSPSAHGTRPSLRIPVM